MNTSNETVSQFFSKSHDNIVTSYYDSEGTLINITYSWDGTPDHPTLYVNEDGYSGYIPKVGYSSTNPIRTDNPDGSYYTTQTFTGYYEGTLTKTITVITYTAYYNGVARTWQVIEESYGDPENSNGKGVGEPVNVATGNFYASAKDISIPDVGLSLEIERFYNSLDDRIGLLGKGWIFSYESKLEIDSQTGYVSAKYPNGRTIKFIYDSSSGIYLKPLTATDVLTKNIDNTYELNVDNKYIYKYNSSGKLTSITDENGNIVTIQYDINGNIDLISGMSKTLDITVTNNKISSITDQLGRTANYLYNGSNNLIQVQTFGGGTIDYTYNSYGLTSINGENDNTFITNLYDQFGRVIKQYDADNNITEYSYDDLNLENTYKVLATGKTIKYKYNDKYYITKETFDDGTYVEYTYDDWGNKNSVRDRNGNITYYTYDNRGNILSVTTPEPFSYTTNYMYDTNYNLIEVNKPDGSITTFDYDANNNLITTNNKIDEITNVITTYTYDSYGRVLTITDPENNITTYEYSNGPNPTKVTDSENNITNYAYDNVGRVITVTTSYGTTTFVYNNHDKVEKIIDPDDNITRQKYDLSGNLVKLILPEQYNETTDDGIGNTYVYDAMEKLIKKIDPLESITRYMYDAEGNKTKEVNANYYNETTDDGIGYVNEYDKDNRVIKVTNPSGQKSRIKYDPVGNIIKVIDANNYNETTDDGLGIQYTYDQLNRLIEIRDTQGNITNKYIYDSNGRIIKEIDAKGYLSGTTDAERYGITYQYNLAGWLLEKREPVVEENGTINYRVTKYEYDKTGKLLKEKRTPEYVDITGEPSSWYEITYTYYRNGYVKTITDSQGSFMEYEYDSLGNTTLERYKINDQKYSIKRYTYSSTGKLIKESKEIEATDLIGELTGIVLTETLYEYDKNGNLTKLITPEGYVTDYEYDAVNRLTAVKEQVTYDSLNENTTSVSIDSPRNLVYPMNQYEYQINLKPDTDVVVKDFAIEIDYDARVFELTEAIPSLTGINIDTNTLGKIYLTVTETNISQETLLAEIKINVKNLTVGLGYITINPASTYTDTNNLTFEFSQGIGKGINSTIPDMDKDTDVETNDLTLTALRKDIGINDSLYHQKYDIDDSGVIDTPDLDYLKDWLFEDSIILNPIDLTRFTEKYTNSIYEKTLSTGTRTTSYQYDKVGNIIKETDTNGYYIENIYDEYNRLIAYKNKEGATYRVFYDELGNKIKEVMPENYNQNTDDGLGTTYVYDSMNRLEQIINSNGIIVKTYVYDLNGQVIQEIDAQSYATEYIYDIGGRIINKTSPEAKDKGKTTVTYTYDALNNIITSTDGENKTTAYQRDMWGNATKVTDADEVDTFYVYDYAGNIISTTDGNNNTTTYSYNSMNLLKSITDPLGQTITYKYDKDGRLREQLDRNGQVTLYNYNSDNNLTSKQVVGNEEEIYLYNQDGSLLATINDKIIERYQYTPNGYIESATRNGETILTYDYNKDGNVISVIDNNSGTTNYTYDTLGRIQNVLDGTTVLATYSYNTDNTISQITYNTGVNINYTYDKNNNITILSNNKAGGTSISNFIYAYDNNGNRLTETENGQTTTYTYDGFNRLTETINPDGTWMGNIYNPDGLRIGTLENGISYEFTYDRGNIINETNASGTTITRSIRGYNLIAQNNIESGLSYYLNNAHGDVINLVDIEGNIFNYYDYDAFGNLTTSIQEVNNRFLYSGEQLDQITGEYYLRARYYNPEIGRFTQEDTYRGDGLNLYTYVQNNPVNFIDPSGHKQVCDYNDSGSTEGYHLPIEEGYLTSGYGWRINDDGEKEFHPGIDIAVEEGTEIYAINDGTMKLVINGNDKTAKTGYGYYITLEFDESITIYGHLNGELPEEIINKFEEKSGESSQGNVFEQYQRVYIIDVKKGELIGYTGDTGISSGPHLHFNLQIEDAEDRYITDEGFSEPNSVNPLTRFDFTFE